MVNTSEEITLKSLNLEEVQLKLMSMGVKTGPKHESTLLRVSTNDELLSVGQRSAHGPGRPRAMGLEDPASGLH